MEHGCGPGHTRQPTRETTERRCVMMQGVNAVKRRSSDAAPLHGGHRRCRRRSWRHVNQPRLKRCVWHGRVVFVVRLFRHGPSPQGPRERAWVRTVSRTSYVGLCRRPRGNRRRCLRASDANQSSTACSSSQRSVTARDAHSAEACRRQALFMAKPSNEPSRTERASVVLGLRAWTQLLKAVQDGHVAGLQVRRASWREEAQHDVRGKWPSWRPRWSRWRGCWPCSREGSMLVLLLLSVQHVVQMWQRARRIVVVVVAQPFSDVTTASVLQQEGCLAGT